MLSFTNAKDVDIKGGNFVNVARDAHLHFGEVNQGLKIIHQNVATGAFYDSAERGNPPKCHPHTRLAVLSAIQEWVQDSDVCRKFIIWIYGPAGSGKSAIAQTIAEIFAKEKLVASFFFSRTGIGRNDTSRFIASISYQLSTSIPKVRPHIAAAVEQDPLIFSRTLLSQMEALIIKPLNAIAADLIQAGAVYPRLVIIDGLDEARDATTQRELLQALATCIQQLWIPLIFFVASRPETIIRQTFNMEPLQSLMQGLALDENYKPDDDIRIFLSAEFNEIRTLHPSGNTLPLEWPTREDIDYLVRKASGQFIYASTVMKYIKTPQRNPRKQLKVIRDMAGPGKDTPFAQLDALYALILSSVEDLTRVLEILTLIFFKIGRYIDEFLSVDFIETLLEYDSGDVAAALTDMHALVRVPSHRQEDVQKLYIYHASLHDFLMDKSRSKDFFLDARVRHVDFARRVLKHITTELEEGSEQDYRFCIALQEFLYHYREVCNLQELVTDLKEFSLTSLLSKISIHIFYYMDWDDFFDFLRSKCIETNTDLYRRLRDEFDHWVCNQYEKYPVFFQHHMAAALVALESSDMDNSTAFIRDIFNILTHILSPSDASCLRKLDRELFLFHAKSVMVISFCIDHRILHNFFTDSSRAGDHFPAKVDFGNLAEQIVKVLYKRVTNCPQIVVRSWSDDRDSDSNCDSGETLKITHENLEFFPKILAAAPEDHKLAKILWELAIKYKDVADDPIRRGRETMAESALEYLKRCGIFVPDHKHQAGCLICVDFTPTFSTPSVEPEEDGTRYTISTPDDPGTSRSGIPLCLSQNISQKTSVIPINIKPSSSFRSPSIHRSPTATRNRTAKVSPSTTPHLSNSRSTSSFSPGSRSIRSSPRPTSADPSTSKSGSRHLSGNLSVNSCSRPRSPTLSNSSLSPRGPSALKVTQTSMGKSPQPQGRYEQSANVGVLPQRRSTSGKASKKPMWK